MDNRTTRRKFLKDGTATAATAVVATGLMGFFGARKAESSDVMRPPGALPESDFLATCIRCGRCSQACPNRCILPFTEKNGKDSSLHPDPEEVGTPMIIPRKQACMLCMGVDTDTLLCTLACPTGALVEVKKDFEDVQEKVHMGTAVVDTNICYSYNGSSCGVCVRACPLEKKALRAGILETPIIDPEYCVGCGLCERACIRYPQAIRIEGLKEARDESA